MKLVSKSTLLLSTFLIGLNVPIAHAQVMDDADTSAVDLREQQLLEEVLESDGGDDIIVTGTRTRRPDLTTAFPTLVVGEDILEKNAFTNLGDALNQIPAFGAGINGEGAQGANIGVNFVNFLGLGSNRTLTLVNGRRFVSSNVISSGGASGSQVDLSVIPVGLIERIETIGVGGAPTYGSDAIAGTVNLILKDDFEGIDARMQYGQTERGDLDTQQYSILMGANTSDGRGNVTFNVEYTKNEGLNQLDRPEIYVDEPFSTQISGNDIAIPGSFNVDAEGRVLDAGGEPVTIDADLDGFFDSIFRPRNLAGGVGQNVQLFTNGGIVSPSPTVLPSIGFGTLADGVLYGFDRSGDLTPLTPGNSIPGQSLFFAEGGFENDFFAQVGQLSAPVKRANFGSTFSYELQDWLTFKGDFQASNVRAVEGLNQGGFQTFAFGGVSAGLEIPTTNPFLSAQARGILADNGIGADDTFYLSRFNNDIINNGAQLSETSLFRLSAGFTGDFNVGDREFYYDVNAVFGEADIERQGSLINNQRFLYAVDAVIDPDTGQIACRATVDNLQDLVGNGISTQSNDVSDCVPINLFGEGVASQEALNYVTQQFINSNDVSQEVFSANIGGDLISLPGGDAQFVVGYETRRDAINFQRDAATVVGLGRASASGNAKGSVVTNEYFGELYVPLVSPEMNIPFVQALEIGGQAREIVNSIAGDFTAWTVEGTWQPIDDISIRGNITRSLRAPSLTELFQPLEGTFSFGRDPCDERFIEEGPNRAANCAAIGLARGFTSDIANASRPGRTGGNRNLINEAAEAFTIGAVIQPRWTPGLTVQVDYLDIDIEDRITVRGLTNNLETCFDADPSEFPNLACDTFTRDAAGQITDFVTGQLNADDSTDRFINVRADYSFDLVDAMNVFGGSNAGDFGEISLDANIFHVLERELIVQDVAQAATVGGFGDPKWSGTIDGTWAKDGFRLFWRATWQDRSLFSASGRNFFADENGDVVNSLGWNWLHNASLSYDLSEALDGYDRPLQIQFNVNNVFDDDPGRGLRRVFNDFYTSEIYGRSYSMVLRASF